MNFAVKWVNWVAMSLENFFSLLNIVAHLLYPNKDSFWLFYQKIMVIKILFVYHL